MPFRYILILGAAVLVTQGCLTTGVHETGRVLDHGETSRLIGVGGRYDVFHQPLEETPLDEPGPLQEQTFSADDEPRAFRTRIIQDTLAMTFRAGVDGMVLWREGLGRGWEREAGLKSSVLTSFALLGHGHAPGIILGTRKQIVSKGDFAAAAGLRWSGDVFVAGGHRLNTFAFLSDLQLRITGSFDFSRTQAIYFSPAIGARIASVSDRGANDERWTKRFQYAYVPGAVLGVIGTGDQYNVGLEVGVDFMPEVSGMTRSYLLPRVGMSFVRR